MKKLSALICVVFVGMFASTASASHDSAVYAAADHYRDAVVHFEREVIRARAFDRYDVRLVDDLEDSTSRLRSAARHVRRSPDHDHRFTSALREVTKLQQRVERAIFAADCYHASQNLVGCWAAVNRAYAILINEANCLHEPVFQPFQEKRFVVPNRAGLPGLKGLPTARVPLYGQPMIGSPFVQPPAVHVQPAPLPQRRSVNYLQRNLQQHANLQAQIGAMLQRRSF